MDVVRRVARCRLSTPREGLSGFGAGVGIYWTWWGKTSLGGGWSSVAEGYLMGRILEVPVAGNGEGWAGDATCTVSVRGRRLATIKRRV